jgi:hypothetical protein
MKSKYYNLDSVLVNSCFSQSLNEHQLFIDVLLANTGSDGLINLSQTQMAKLLGKSQTLISGYIKQLNRIDQCISQIARGVYRLNYSDIVNNGVFPIIRKSLTKIMINPGEYIFLSYKDKADYLNVEIKLIPVIEAYFYMDLI